MNAVEKGHKLKHHISLVFDYTFFICNASNTKSEGVWQGCGRKREYTGGGNSRLGSGELGSRLDSCVNELCNIGQVTQVLELCKTGVHTIAVSKLWNTVTCRNVQWGLGILQ